MHMEFRVYQMLYPDDLTEKGDRLVEFLKRMTKIPGEYGFKYCITNEFDFTENIITFCFSEEYASDVNSVDDDKNNYNPDVSPYINTIMAIDLQEKRLLVQNRHYPANTLNKDQTMTRIGLMLNEAFDKIYATVFNYLPTDRLIFDDDFTPIFKENRISLLWATIPKHGRFIPEGEEVFKDEGIDNSNWIKGWNSDSSDVFEVLLKAPGKGGEGDLRNSPIARSLMKMLGVEIKQLDFWDDENKHHKIARSSLKRFVVKGINHRTHAITAVDKLATEIYSRREELRSFSATSEI
ncbi:hypothetical protein P4310_30875 [Bacillus thuringiensis]|uniref:hypothetical protein n=1 Tax=Bacillus thuringiensis TaxID=1428 RepID=UPI000A3C7529|nr:hypothetical protein [Bacillus thuringiensis]MCU4984479.1 hypothetical protein [Bacillus cereus]MED3069790.1 hypothetical protein [Bacillus thuringiensis]OUB31607.1 hypothetical protein BK737_15595 [Bacillus thuringiensis serovar palmanyolensis]